MFKKVLLLVSLSVMALFHVASAASISPEIYADNQGVSAAQVKLAAMNYANFWNTGEAKFARLALAKNFVDKTPPKGRKAGIEGVLAASKAFRQAVPDLHVSVEHLLITGKYATVRYRFKGHFSGTLGEQQGHNQVIDFPAVDIYQVENGKIIANWHLEDYQTFFSQVK
ncbi:ester cyclase [Shewanella intestini]|uniref:Ester cyclase n=1 Tax=Shewanella intestini TaxID=2017544 RepID=A0ABS5HYN5_9GAMM|nr:MULTISPECIES: ester cyclase [Shewanella]MBR9726881.1 ester cyclase [Shewanella intestini]MRG34553.1 ester cyclase [Shewanella sp. XMDDZSB0408]